MSSLLEYRPSELNDMTLPELLLRSRRALSMAVTVCAVLLLTVSDEAPGLLLQMSGVI
jgi:hypothetical protein